MNRAAVIGKRLLSNWENRLTVILCGLFLYQFVTWIQMEDGLWLPLTVKIVNYTLLITLCVELLPLPSPGWRRSIQFTAILFMLGRILDYQWVAISIDSWEQFLYGLNVNLLQLSPFIWFSLPAWSVYVLFLWWVQDKWRIVYAIFAAILFFAIRDSYSMLNLWKQVSMIIFCGLCLLVIRHFADFKRKNPESWSYLKAYPASIIIPIALFIVTTVTLGSFAPNLPPLVTDPYTAWKMYRGESIAPIQNNAKESLLRVQLNTGQSRSGYSRNDEVLGEGFQFDYTEIMTVSTPVSSYWRGETRHFYTGKGWENQQDATFSTVTLGERLRSSGMWNAEKRQTREIKQTFTMLTDTTYPVLFGAYQIEKIESLDGAQDEQLLWSPERAELRWNGREAATYPKEYEVVSQIPIINEEAIRASNVSPPEASEFQPYLQLPSSLPDPVVELAHSITEDVEHPYDKVKAIERYLKENYTYNNQPDLEKQRSEDFVYAFLFEIQEGYCDYYSTAMAVMTRAIGMPTRWVKGYTTGSLPEEEMLMYRPQDDLSGGTYTVQNANAHSWVEVYFHGWGWIPFEPTPGFSFPQIMESAESETPLPESNPTPEVAEEDSTTRSWQAWLTAGGVILLAGMLLLFGRKIGAKRLLTFVEQRIPWKKIRTRFPVLNRRYQSEDERIMTEFKKLWRLGKKKGYIRHDHETVRETLQKWARMNRRYEREFDALLQIFEKIKYDTKTATYQDLLEVTGILQRLRKHW